MTDEVNPDDWGTGLPSAGGDDGFGSAEYGFDDMDVGGADGAKIGSGKLKVDKKGPYHFAIHAEAKPKPYEDSDMSKQRKPSILVKHTVLRAANGVPEGAIHYHDLVLGGKGGGPVADFDRDKTLNYLVGIGVLKNDGGKIIDPETGTTKIKTSTLVERINKVGQIIGVIHYSPANKGQDGREYPEKYEFNFGRGAYQVTAKEVQHVPCNEDALKAAGIVRGPAKANV